MDVYLWAAAAAVATTANQSFSLFFRVFFNRLKTQGTYEV